MLPVDTARNTIETVQVKASLDIPVTQSTTRDTRQSTHRYTPRRIPSSVQNALVQIYSTTPYPTTQLHHTIACVSGISPKTIRIWFQNRRQKERDVNKRASLIHRQRTSHNPIDTVDSTLSLVSTRDVACQTILTSINCFNIHSHLS
ncbi:hypothetical protein BDV3_003112 [Batrachochytrium dendrobatidis]|uniref:Homeobox domain-containing protein n=1 Tax=Batrachochytrium dendrobatidis (strain JEL423) TaxID=403673 RepID=A0A177WXH9_BATDL|nr:hypothetical protein BDEG_27995 [Batrachochytrium dendrobatidis JEL423]